jgi:signal transduction histidine kinase
VTDIAHESVDAASEPRPRRFSWAADNPLVRAVGRVRLPLGAKLLIGFAVVGALLSIGYVLGFVSLSQSNSRGEQLRRLQAQAVYEQLLVTDASQLKKAVDYRIASTASTKHFGSGLDQSIANDMNQLCADAGIGNCLGAGTPQPLPLKLVTIDPPLVYTLARSRTIFYPISGDVSNIALKRISVPSTLRNADRFAGSYAAKLRALADRTRAHANALVAANRSSFGNSRDLLIGVGAGSLLLALALGLLLSWSIVAPLRSTESRLDEIAAGDFSGRLEVANRDEIGSLAAKVNTMSDELQRVYGELETASRHKSDFLATMSHELRTPLNAIIGFSEVLHEQMFGELNERQLAYVNDVLEAGRHLLSLINDVLDLAKIEAGKMELELSQVTLPELLRSAISIHSERADRAGIGLSLSTEPDEITITADERRVRQIVFNLLSNAVKFTPADGRVDVSARLDDGKVEIAVADTGPGIAAHDLETIFEEFEQTNEGKQAEGTGLGLPLSRKLVELHGGHLWAESTPGHGSTFRFTLPVHQEAQ